MVLTLVLFTWRWLPMLTLPPALPLAVTLMAGAVLTLVLATLTLVVVVAALGRACFRWG